MWDRIIGLARGTAFHSITTFETVVAGSTDRQAHPSQGVRMVTTRSELVDYSFVHYHQY
jgi:hypothetical protein